MKKTKVLVFAALLTGGVCMQAQEVALPKQIKIGKERVKARRELRLPEIDGYQLLKCDFHVHTIFSDGIVWPTLRVQEAWEEGLDAIAITDHIEGQPARQHVGKGHNNAFDMAKEEVASKPPTSRVPSSSGTTRAGAWTASCGTTCTKTSIAKAG